jgi:hypothetical protein
VAAKLALDLIDAVDPQAKLVVEQGLPSDPEGVNALSLSHLLSLAEQHGISAETLVISPSGADSQPLG